MTLKNEYAGTYTEEGLIGLRHNMSMYVDSTNATADGKAPVGLTQLAQELISNTTDEYLNGYGHEVKIVIHPDNSMTISDHGRGLVRGEKDTFEDVIRNAWIPHTSGKFAEAAGYTARGTTGMHGIGLKATNAGSVYLTIHAVSHSIIGRNTDTTKAHLDGGYDEYEITFHNVSKNFDTKLIHHWTKDEVTEIEPDDPKRGSNQFKINATGEIKTTGTSITFLPDTGPISEKNQNPVFGSRNWNDNDLLPRMNAAAYLNPNFEVDFTDERYKVQNEDTGEEELFHKHYVYRHGIKDYIKVLAEGQPLISGMTKSIELDGVTDYEGLSYDLQGELLFTNDLSTTIISFANGAPTPQGGPHLDGFKRAIVKTLTDYAINAKAIKSAKEFDDNDILEGITAVFEIRTPMSVAKFDGQTKGRFATDQSKPVTQEIVSKALNNWLYAHQKQADALVHQMKDAQKLRQDLLKKKQDQKAANKAKNNTSAFISPKLKEASGKNPADLELYLTEGDSASNIGRDPKTQAVFPLRGNIKNAMDISLSTALQNDEISTIQNVIGAGIGPSFDVSDMRYGKIIIAADGDSDGNHIRSLLIALFYQYFPGLIQTGKLYAIEPPLYKATKYVNGKTEIRQFYSEQEIDSARNQLKGYDIQRYKGLGEMDEKEAHDAIVDPKSRRLLRITIDDAEQASRTLRVLLGSDAKPRKKWIEKSIDFDALYDAASDDAGDE